MCGSAHGVKLALSARAVRRLPPPLPPLPPRSIPARRTSCMRGCDAWHSGAPWASSHRAAAAADEEEAAAAEEEAEEEAAEEAAAAVPEDATILC